MKDGNGVMENITTAAQTISLTLALIAWEYINYGLAGIFLLILAGCSLIICFTEGRKIQKGSDDLVMAALIGLFSLIGVIVSLQYPVFYRFAEILLLIAMEYLVIIAGQIRNNPIDAVSFRFIAIAILVLSSAYGTIFLVHG